ncbi:cell division protein FtsQ/DivIB [Domibacillus epiphyticus]|uniref:Cell division protein DivIB n=1 Tax=Domibacillus epiphyticus TaxID=1714355 RepID=A0A1V2AC02_9BACI|nr:FtsQ-type POTRA domain-containing protein [Domibacillus epiphyticus]OMP68523.1 cell division protein FtsQ [Domibacillus epiphyticus]
MNKQKIISIEDRIPKLKEMRKRKANRRLIILLSLFLLLALLLIYLQSPLSKVEQIHIEGNNLISEKEIIEQSGLNIGSNIWSADKRAAEKKLLSDDRIKKAHISTGFPNDLKVTVTEQHEIAYAARNGGLYPVLENGKIVAKAVNGPPSQLPILYDFKEGEALDHFAKAILTLPDEVVNTISEVYHDPKPNDPLHIKAYMTDGFEVSATLSTFGDKMIYYPSISNQLDPNVKGVIDLEVGSYFKAYDPSKQQKLENESLEEAETP